MRYHNQALFGGTKTNVSSSLEQDKITMLHNFYRHISQGLEKQTSFFSEELPPLQTIFQQEPF